MIPPELEAELYDRLVSYYESNPDVTVIIERLSGPDRRRGRGATVDNRREIRDRRRARATGTFPTVEAPE